MNVTRKDLVDRIHDFAHGETLPKAQIDKLLGGLLETIVEALVAGNTVILRGFGTFEPVQTAPRVARNPATGEPVQVPAKTKIRFRPAQALRNL